MLDRLRALTRTRRMLVLLIGRDLKVKYAKSALGYFWSILDPLLMSCVYWFVFTKIFIRGSIGEQPYILFLVCALLPWYWASGVISGSVRALSKDARLVRSSSLSRELWVLRIVGSKGAEFVLSLPVVLLFVLLTQTWPSGYLWAWPLAMLIQFIFLLGVGLILAPLTVLYNDVARLIRVSTRVLFYMSPVIYGVQDVYATDAIPGWLKQIYVLNPLTGIFDLYRAAFFPQFFSGWREVATAAIVACTFFGVGMIVFSRLERPVLKEI